MKNLYNKVIKGNHLVYKYIPSLSNIVIMTFMSVFLAFLNIYLYINVNFYIILCTLAMITILSLLPLLLYCNIKDKIIRSIVSIVILTFIWIILIIPIIDFFNIGLDIRFPLFVNIFSSYIYLSFEILSPSNISKFISYGLLPDKLTINQYNDSPKIDIKSVLFMEESSNTQLVPSSSSAGSSNLQTESFNPEEELSESQKKNENFRFLKSVLKDSVGIFDFDRVWINGSGKGVSPTRDIQSGFTIVPQNHNEELIHRLGDVIDLKSYNELNSYLAKNVEFFNEHRKKLRILSHEDFYNHNPDVPDEIESLYIMKYVYHRRHYLELYFASSDYTATHRSIRANQEYTCADYNKEKGKTYIALIELDRCNAMLKDLSKGIDDTSAIIKTAREINSYSENFPDSGKDQ